jgi:3-oxoacyl-[acyl-carrier protein] reductase
VSLFSLPPVFLNKTILITGANRGIGRVTAEAFARVGACLIVHSRSPTPAFADDMLDLAARYNVTIERVVFDMTDTAAMKAEINAILPPKRQIDVLVNNAGVAHGGLFQMTPLTDVRSVFDVNFFAQLELTQLIIRRMSRQKSGAIVNIGSIAGLELASGNVGYGVSKAALMAFTQTLASEVGHLGVRVNAVAPGLVDTEMANQMEKKAGTEMIQNSAMKRLATAEEIAQVVLFLSSDVASFVNGQVIPVNGGRA